MAPPSQPDSRLALASTVAERESGQRTFFDLWDPPPQPPPPAPASVSLPVLSIHIDAVATASPANPSHPAPLAAPTGLYREAPATRAGRAPRGMRLPRPPLVALAALPPVPPRPGMRVVVLGSGSGGNAVVVESGAHRILIDAGFSSRELTRRMASVGIDPRSLSALVLTHEHIDHCRGVGRLARRYQLAVFATAGTLRELRLDDATRDRATVLRSGEPRDVAGFQIEPFLLPHDAREPIGMVVSDGDGRRLGLVADCGTRSHLAWARLRDLDLLVMETNHDLDMLRNGPYPWSLKQRVAGRHGHLSNREAAEGLPELLCDRLRWVVLYHLSRTNNLPALAAATISEALAREGCGARLEVSAQDRPTPWLELGEEAAVGLDTALSGGTST